jgi:hypothetical protein
LPMGTRKRCDWLPLLEHNTSAQLCDQHVSIGNVFIG